MNSVANLNNNNDFTMARPNEVLLSLGEISVNYLNFKSKTFLKVASYILTLGILPAIASVTRLVYTHVQNRHILFLTLKASQSMEGALWVTENIRFFRLSDNKKAGILNTTIQSIRANYQSFLNMPAYKDNPALWLKNFGFIDPSCPRTTLKKLIGIEEGKITTQQVEKTKNEEPIKENSYNPVFESVNDYLLIIGLRNNDMILNERQTFLREVAKEGILPPKDTVTDAERFDIISTLAKSPNNVQHFSNIFEGMSDYEFTQVQRFQILELLIKTSCQKWSHSKILETPFLTLEIVAQCRLTHTQRIDLGKILISYFFFYREKLIKAASSKTNKNLSANLHRLLLATAPLNLSKVDLETLLAYKIWGWTAEETNIKDNFLNNRAPLNFHL